jgi:hypothetical protein
MQNNLKRGWEEGGNQHVEEFIQPQEEDLTRTPITIAMGHSRPTQERNSNMVVLIQEAMEGRLLSFLDVNQVVK